MPGNGGESFGRQKKRRKYEKTGRIKERKEGRKTEGMNE
jgi:hypothetical protein